MEAHEIPYGGVYRLSINGQLVGEFVPGPTWTQLYECAQKLGVATYEWRPFEKLTEAEKLRILTEALQETENHIPRSVSRDWIVCSCENSVRPSYWVRHAQGADGSALAKSVLETVASPVN